MPTYIESALGDFIKTILTRGVKTLKSPRFFPYSLFLLLIVIVTTTSAFLEQLSGNEIDAGIKDIFLFIELSAAIAFILIGIFLGKSNTTVQMISIIVIVSLLSSIMYFEVFGNSEQFAFIIAALLYILWIGIVAFSTFSLFRDLFANSTFGTVLFLGKADDDGKVMFSYLAWLLVIINILIGYYIYTNYNDKQAIILSAIVIITLSIIATFPLLGIQKNNDVFFTIMTIFYMFTTIKIFLFSFKVVSGSSESTSFWDTLFSLFIALYTIQNAAVKGIKLGEKIDDEDDRSLEEKLMDEERGKGLFGRLGRFLSDRGLVLLILGVVLGYHTMQIQTILGRDNIFNEFGPTSDADIVILGYEVNLIITLFIYVFSMIFFFFSDSYRRYASPDIHRIPWLPPYDELKIVASQIKTGEMSWKKVLLDIGKDALTSKFSRKDRSTEEKFTSTWNKITGKKKKK